MNLTLLTDEVLKEKKISKKEALFLYNQDLANLCHSADKIRQHFCKNEFDICTIINAKSGNCSENCKFCAQSAHNNTHIDTYTILPKKDILSQAKINSDQGVLRFSLVTSGKYLTDKEIDDMCEIITAIKENIGISICVSFGLLNEKQFQKLKNAGVTRIHNNLETSKKNFSNICTTHTFEDKLKSIQAAQSVGLSVCSGGIMGLGESIEDRIDMAFTLQKLGIKSVPINILTPIAGTPFEKNEPLKEDTLLRIIATYRFILPKATIRLAGGRGSLFDKGKACFISGANGAISGDMLTTTGITTQKDMKLIKELGYEVKLCNE